MLRLRTFGSVDLKGPEGRDLGPVLAQPKRLALLVYLAAARPSGVRRRDDLLALFWPDLDESRARDALNQALSFLRQALGAETLVRRGADEVGIDPERLWCDAVAFQAALDGGNPDGALALYRGDFLQGFFIEDGGGFEEWMERERAAHRESAARGARQLADAHAEGGALTLAIDWGRRVVELAPDDERALRRLLLLCERAGDRAGALHAYDRYARRLREEYASEPAGETRAIVERLRRAPVAVPQASESVRLEPVVPEGAGFTESYRIERELGAGGMATVYLARDLKHDRDVAIKILRPEIAEGLARERFVREIRIAGRLQHPNIVPLFDSGESGGRLFYVMPHVQGETLRDRLTREGPLPVDDVVHLLRELAGALAYAHGQGVIHRDIKPANILLIDRRAVLADFGIARAAHAAMTPGGIPADTLTQVGISLGTPAYMSPEQVAGSSEVDQRADLYALGSVAYEMLTGRAPFAGGTAQEVLAAQLAEAPIPVAERRADAPPGLAALVMQCLEKKPSERPASAREFLARLDGAEVGKPLESMTATDSGTGSPADPRRRARIQRARAVAGVGALLLLVSASLAVFQRPGTSPAHASDSAVADTSRYAVLPFTHDRSETAGLPIEQFVQDGLRRWGGVGLVDRFQLNDVMSRRGTGVLTSEDARQIALASGAGRYVRGEVTPMGDSLRVHAGLYDATRTNRMIADATVRVAAGLAGADSGFAALADRLLFPASAPGVSAGAGGGTRSLPARQAYERGQVAIQDWELARADSELVRATDRDDQYTEAFLWLAQVRSWRGLPATQWGFAADRATAGRGKLTRRDRVLSDALVALAANEIPAACSALIALTKQEPHDFAAWYGMGTCLSRDSIVVVDRRSPSGFAFRSSYHTALKAYTKAFELLPSMHKSLSVGDFAQVRTLLKTSVTNTRSGVAAADSATFAAFPSLNADTLSFIPLPLRDAYGGDAGVVPKSAGAAVEHQRQLFHEIAARWVAKYPESSRAVEALAVSMALLADPAALDTMRRARSLAKTPEEWVRMSGVEVWMRLTFSIPSDLRGVRNTRLLVDSLLRANDSTSTMNSALMVSLAVLTGRANQAVEFARRPEAALWGLPAPIRVPASALLVFGALGGPPDSIDAIAQAVELGIRTTLKEPLRESARLAVSVRAATLAFPNSPPAGFDLLQGGGDYLLAAQQAAHRGDSGAVRRILKDVQAARQAFSPGDLSLDAVFPEAHLLASIGDYPSATAWLDPVLTSRTRTPPQASGDPAAVGALVRACVLRAELAERAGDLVAARRWAEVVTILWSDADPFLQPVVDRMRRLAKRTG